MIITKLNTYLNEAYNRAQKECDLKEGDTVRIVRAAQSQEKGWGLEWNKERMDENVGKTFKILKVDDVGCYGVCLHENYWYPFFILEKVDAAVEYKLNASYTALITKDEVKVGCQTFPWAVIKGLVTAHKKLVDSK